MILSLFLACLANLGLTVHSGHHSPVVPSAATTTRYLAQHSEPDSTLHLEDITAVRTLACPGCVLQQQLGGSHLLGLGSPDQVVLTKGDLDLAPGPISTRTFTPRSPRGPPVC